ncbi:MAG: hypothetical protein ABWK05_05520 [Pyrobaculum sp.]
MLNVPLYLALFSNAFFPPNVGLLSGLTYLLAYYVACGRYLAPAAIYLGGFAALAAQDVYNVKILDVPVIVLYFITALIISIIYASVFVKGKGKKLFSIFLILVAVVVGSIYALTIGTLWRLAVPSIGVAPWLPEPQDAPLYILLYELWRLIHASMLKVSCRKPNSGAETPQNFD